MFDRRLKLGRYFSIDLYVHWTFALLLAFIAFNLRDQGVTGMLFGVMMILGGFFCVTLHEYGHALTARAFGVPTLDITLLPIGGVARLKRMPRVPWQELLVAVAGPAVNVVIVMLLGGAFLAYYGWKVYSGQPVDSSTVIDALYFPTQPSLKSYAMVMLMINLMLIVFNMIPAFPMDGGRVFRSVLAMAIDYRRATRIASRVGLVFALLMAWYGLFGNGNPMTVLIAMFIAYAGLAEAKQVDVLETIRSASIAGGMVTQPRRIDINTPLHQLVHTWRSVSESVLPVVTVDDLYAGMLSIQDIDKALAEGMPMNTTAGELARHDVEPVSANLEEEAIGAKLSRPGMVTPVVDQDGRLIGMVALDTLASRSRIAQFASSLVTEPTQPDDASLA